MREGRPNTGRREVRMNLNSIMIGSEKPDALTEYYSRLFGKPVWDEGDYKSWQIGTGSVTVAPHDQVKGKNKSPGRILWNIETPDVKGDFDKLKAAGAIVVQEPYRPSDEYEMWVATFADPDDNYFQLMSEMQQE
jgi:predicted enzyme related to lactoylglutathione lyase